MPRRKFHLTWGQALAEVLLIFVGITLAVAFNNWNENRKDNKLRQGYYERLLAELKQDRQDLAAIRSYHEAREQGIQLFYKYLDSVSKPDVDSVQHFIQTFSYHMSTYVPNESTYRELISTGNIKLMETHIREQLLRLSQMHSYVVETQKSFDKRYQDRRDQMAEVIDEATFYKLRWHPDESIVAWQRDLTSEGFRRYSNLLAVRLSIAQTLISMFNNLDERCQDLISVIASKSD